MSYQVRLNYELSSDELLKQSLNHFLYAGNMNDLKSKFDIDFDKLLGSSIFTSVYKGIDKKTSTQIAIKQFPKSLGDFEDVITELSIDIQLMQRILKSKLPIDSQPEKYLKPIEYYIHQTKDDFTGEIKFQFFIIYPLAQTNLETYIIQRKKEGSKINENEVLEFLKQTLLSLDELKTDHQIQHRDIKPANILIYENNNENKYILADFNVSRIKVDSENTLHLKSTNATYERLSKNLEGTKIYLPLNVRQKEVDGVDVIKNFSGEKFDIYALGICSLEMLFPEITLKQLADNESGSQLQQQLVSKIQNQQLQQLIGGMIEYDSNKRLNIIECLLKLNIQNQKEDQQLMDEGLKLEEKGDYQQALTKYLKSYELRKQLKGENELSTIKSLESVSWMHFRLGDYKLTEKFNRQILKQKVEILKEDDWEIGFSMRRLGDALYMLGQYDEAQKYYEKSLEIAKKQLGEQHIEYGKTMNNLAIVLDNQGKYDEAKQLYEKVLVIDQQLYGENHLQTTPTLENLANVLRNQGNYDESKQLYEKVLVIRIENYGENHINTATTMQNLATVFQDQGKYNEAKQLYEKVLVINKQHYGENHPQTATTMENLGNSFYYEGKYQKAKQLYEKVLEIKKQHYGENHPQTARTIENLANIFQNQGKYDEAKQLYEEILVIKKQHYGENHPQTARTIENLANIFQNQGKYDEAKQLYEEILVIKKQHYGENHPETARTIENLANIFQNQGKYDEAKQLYEEVLVINKQHYGENHPETARTKFNISFTLVDLNQKQIAQQYLQETLIVYQDFYGPDHQETQRVIKQLKKFDK